MALAASLLAAPVQAQRQPPEPATGFTPKPLAQATTHMVAAAHPIAVDAGLDILRAGGSALDAAIAVQMVLNLVEPQSSGVGGGGFLLHWDQATRTLVSYDGRETAPAAITPDIFLYADGSPRRFREVIFSGASIGVPGLVRMLTMAHQRHGRLPWPRLFAAAIRLAEQGFPVSPRLSRLLALWGPRRFGPTARAYFFDADGRPRAPGTKLTNPAFAATLRQVATTGAAAFYTGEIAAAVVRAVREAPNQRGTMTMADLAGYVAKQRPPVCADYRRYRVCGMGPPSSGGLAVGATLKLIAPYDLGLAPMSWRALHVIAEAEKLSYADRNHWIADPDHVAVPAGLLDSHYLTHRRRLIQLERVLPKAQPGRPPGTRRGQNGADVSIERAGTSHISIIDRDGNAVAMTTTIESGFGSGLMAAGFLLNNELTDFSFRPIDRRGRAIANAPGPQRRPRSSMAPTIMFDADGEVFAVLGSPGGSRIPLYVIKSVVALIDWRLDAQRATDLANFGSRNGPLELERDRVEADTIRRLTALGHKLRFGRMTSGSHIIVRRGPKSLEGGADPRREGIASGD